MLGVEPGTKEPGILRTNETVRLSPLRCDGAGGSTEGRPGVDVDVVVRDDEAVRGMRERAGMADEIAN